MGLRKKKQCCCVPGCDNTSERSCMFASFDEICEAASVSVSEEELSNMWNQAACNSMALLDLTQYGWKIVDGKLECDWESVENREDVQQQLGLLFRGCPCSSVVVTDDALQQLC